MVTNRGDRLAVVARALIVLAEAERAWRPSTELADVLDVHPVVIRRLLGVLRGEGIVESRTGPKGGWAIGRDPSTITLGQLHRLLVGEPEVTTPAELDEALIAAEEAYAAKLDELSLTALMS